MGEFVTVPAIETENEDAVSAATGRFFESCSWPARPVGNAEPVTEDDVLFFPPLNGWTVILWPAYFTELAAVESISRDLGVLVSTVRIHDGDYWCHSLLRNGSTLDRFASVPDYFTDDSGEIARLKAAYAGRPAIVAEAAGRTPDQVAPYFVPVATQEMGKAFDDDEFGLDDPWVFTDFWRRPAPARGRVAGQGAGWGRPAVGPRCGRRVPGCWTFPND
ncbi:hypothetical protein JOF56_007795 [Kibdelosporangium banguiense]|uniref:Uncharacterized protein n=1 Tax=Kibdelosporangium banguiense TaxID=1365924 RepID=A0ABS4TTX0_9PSEU|nr:hypothetical protein [Kibdelosporangium banguiense]MBP2327410.1 hypothetical protein [Kibdelosporangium banguiense]